MLAGADQNLVVSLTRVNRSACRQPRGGERARVKKSIVAPDWHKCVWQNDFAIPDWLKANEKASRSGVIRESRHGIVVAAERALAGPISPNTNTGAPTCRF
jgi:hypothetical protein